MAFTPQSTPVGPIRRAQRRLGLLFVIPPLALFAVFVLFPLASTLYFSTTSWNGVTANPEIVGLGNYRQIASDPMVWHALKNNIVWILIGTAAPLVLGLLLAVMLWSKTRFVLVFRTMYFMPFVLPGVIIGIVWSWIYSPLGGWLNRMLQVLGLGGLARGWLGDPNTALYAVLATAIWATFGFVVVILLAALQNVDLNLIDAALLDGANAYQRIRYIILPQIMPVFLMVTTVILVGGFSVFDIVFVMTGGGPGNATEVIGTYTYKTAFRYNEVGYGSALALLIATLSLPFAIALNWRRHRGR